MWVRGLKHISIVQICAEVLSHPMWVRGLKHNSYSTFGTHGRRTLCGCVD